MSSTHKPRKRKVESDLDEAIHDRLRRLMSGGTYGNSPEKRWMMRII